MVRGRFIDKKFLHGKADRWKHELAKKYLKENYKEFISSFEVSKVEENLNQNSPIWYFGAQGINSAPPVVLTCIESIKKHNPNRKVIFLDMNNYYEYVNLHSYIVDK